MYSRERGITVTLQRTARYTQQCIKACTLIRQSLNHQWQFQMCAFNIICMHTPVTNVSDIHI